MKYLDLQDEILNVTHNHIQTMPENVFANFVELTNIDEIFKLARQRDYGDGFLYSALFKTSGISQSGCKQYKQYYLS